MFEIVDQKISQETCQESISRRKEIKRLMTINDLPGIQELD